MARRPDVVMTKASPSQGAVAGVSAPMVRIGAAIFFSALLLFVVPDWLIKFFPDLSSGPEIFFLRFGPFVLLGLPLMIWSLRSGLQASSSRQLTADPDAVDKFLNASDNHYVFDADEAWLRSWAGYRWLGITVVVLLALAGAAGLYWIDQFSGGAIARLVPINMAVGLFALLVLGTPWLFASRRVADARKRRRIARALLDSDWPYLEITKEGIRAAEWSRDIIPWDKIERIDRWAGTYRPGEGERATLLLDGYWLVVRDAPLHLAPLRRAAERDMLRQGDGRYSFGIEVAVPEREVMLVDGAMMKLAPDRLKPFGVRQGTSEICGPYLVSRVA